MQNIDKIIVISPTPDEVESDVKRLRESNYKVDLIDFYTMDLEKLSIVAKNRVMPVTTTLVYSGAKIIARHVGAVITDAQISKIKEI